MLPRVMRSSESGSTAMPPWMKARSILGLVLISRRFSTDPGMAMRIFENFGFQMIVATPLKSVMTLEPFIGGACFVAINGRHDSGVLMIEYDAASQRLDLPRAAAASGADAQS